MAFRTVRWAAAALTLAAASAGVALAHPNREGGDGGGAATAIPATPDAAGRFLPDLVQIMPGRVEVTTRRSRRGTRTLLGFASSVENYGTGPLILRASRPSRATSAMTARQVVARSDGRREVVAADAGPLRFVRGGGHSHWHLMGFQRFELRTVAGRTLRRDRKSGFCLGDRYDATGATRIPGEPATFVYTRRCGLGQPFRTTLSQGISVGYGDDYPPTLEGQYVDITGLRTGRYVLVHRSDPAGRLVELDKANNVASMLVKIVRGRRTRARILSWCNFTESCPVPGLHKR